MTVGGFSVFALPHIGALPNLENHLILTSESDLTIRALIGACKTSLYEETGAKNTSQENQFPIEILPVAGVLTTKHSTKCTGLYETPWKYRALVSLIHTSTFCPRQRHSLSSAIESDGRVFALAKTEAKPKASNRFPFCNRHEVTNHYHYEIMPCLPVVALRWKGEKLLLLLFCWNNFIDKAQWWNNNQTKSRRGKRRVYTEERWEQENEEKMRAEEGREMGA